MSDTPSSTSISSDFEVELGREERITLAHEAWLAAGGTGNKLLSITKAADRHGIPKSTLVDRISKGKQARLEAHEDQQRLSPGEEAALLAWILRLQAWGWPPRVEQVRSMANDLLLAKGDEVPIGLNWPKKFMKRHPEIKSVYISPLDKERAMAQDPTILQGWFDLYLKLRTEFEVEKHNIYNMDEKGFMMGVIAKLRVMLNKYEIIDGKKKKRKAYMTQCGSREWVSLIECVSLDGRVLDPLVIFKGKQIQKAWKDALHTDIEITMSENGWTDNSIGLAWLQNCFDAQTKDCKKGEYRMLLIDGHASHITTSAIQYCIDQKIILVCLPPHTTHLLQPLDVGIFAPLATAYKNGIHRITSLGANYKIDKCDFLSIYQQARKEAITPINVKKAWAATGLSPFKPELIVQQFSHSAQYSVEIRPTTPPEATITKIGPSGFSIALTPANSLQIQQILREIERNLGPGVGRGVDFTQVLKKVGKAAVTAMADATIQNKINEQLVEVNKRKKAKCTRAKGHYGAAKFLNEAALNERKANQAQSSLKAVITSFLRLGPDIFAPKPRPTPRKKKPVCTITPIRSPFHTTVTAIPTKRPPGATPSKLHQAGIPPEATPSKPPQAGMPAKQPPKRPPKMIVKLPTRVTTAGLDRGLQGRTVQKRLIVKLPIRVTTAQLGQRQQLQKQGAHVMSALTQSGRSMRLRKPRKL